MKLFLAVLFSCCCLVLQAQETALFNREGKAVAYVADDPGHSIYLWNGTPVAYLGSSRGDFDIWGFNGQHLGWLVDGVLYNHDGETVGVTRSAALMYTEWEPPKAYKKAKPLKGIRSRVPYKPYWRRSWSATPLSLFLEKGLSD